MAERQRRRRPRRRSSRPDPPARGPDEFSGSFARWLCDSLDREAAAPAAGVTRPVRLTEVEALGLLVVALDTEARAADLGAAARRLAIRLRHQLDRLPRPT